MKKDIKHSKMAEAMLNNIPRRVLFACPLIMVINIAALIILTKNIAYPTIVSIPFSTENCYLTTNEDCDVLIIKIRENIEEKGIKEQNSVNLRLSILNPNENGVVQGKIIKIDTEENGYQITIDLHSWPYTTYRHTVEKDIILEGFCDVITMNVTFFSNLPKLFNFRR